MVGKGGIEVAFYLAQFKAVGESVAKPLLYYENNISGLVSLLKVVTAARIPNFIFSSSATVYGDGLPPFTESSPTGPGITNPYGQTKFMAEQILRDVQKVGPGRLWHCSCIYGLIRCMRP